MNIEARLRAASRPERDKAIIDARKAGWTIREIRDVVGYSVGQIHKILKENEQK